MTINIQIPNSTIKRVTGYILLAGLGFWYFYVLFTPYYPGAEKFEAIFFPLVIFGINIIFMSLFEKTTRHWWVLPVVMSLVAFLFSMQDIHVEFPWDMIFASISNESYRQKIINEYTLQGYRIEGDIESLHRAVQIAVYSYLETALISIFLSFLFVKLKKHFKGKREKAENA